MNKYGYHNGYDKTVKGVFLTDEEIARLKAHDIEARNVRTGVRLYSGDVAFLKNDVYGIKEFADITDIAEKI